MNNGKAHRPSAQRQPNIQSGRSKAENDALRAVLNAPSAHIAPSKAPRSGTAVKKTSSGTGASVHARRTIPKQSTGSSKQSTGNVTLTKSGRAVMKKREPQKGEMPRSVRTPSSLTAKKSNKLSSRRSAEKSTVRVRVSPDRIMIALILVLLGLGTIMVFSASYPSALQYEHDKLYYIKRQVVWVIAGLIAMIIISVFPYKFFKRISLPAYGASLALLIVVLFIGIAEGSAKRWIGIPNTTFSFQPSEVMKLALVMILAWYFDRFSKKTNDRLDRRGTVVYGVVIPALFIGVACLLVLLEKHLSGMIILALIGLCVMFMGGSHLGWTAGLFGTAGVVGGAVYLLANPYAMQRVTTYFDKNADVLSDKWQTTQGLYAIGSGGLLGVGLGESRLKYNYVSQAQNDFIFTIYCEEFGFVGAVVLIALFIAFIWRGYSIAMKAPDTFSTLLVFGIISKVGIQTFLNIAVVTDLIPNTGVTLPFFSYGGSSLLILMVEMGIVLSVSRHSYIKKES